MDLSSPLSDHALVHYCQGGIAGRAYVAADEEDVTMGDLGDAVGSSKALCSDHIDQKVE